jgi:hypothetical protein
MLGADVVIRGPHRGAIGASLAAAWVLGAGRATAADSDAQIAQTLFDEARTLLEAGRFAEACPKLAESQRLDPGGGTLLNLAFCHEREGKTATAWLEFRDALAQAEREHRDDRAAFARAHIADLGPKLVKITIVVPSGMDRSELEVYLDTSRVPREAWHTALRVDPGDHRVSTSAAGAAPWTTTIHAVDPGQVYDVIVANPAAVEEKPPRPVERRRGVAFWLTLSGAGALAVTSAVSGVLALSADRYVKDHCSAARDFCWATDANDARTRARTLAWVSTGTLGAAVAAAAVAFLLPLDARAKVTAGVVTGERHTLGVLRVPWM